MKLSEVLKRNMASTSNYATPTTRKNIDDIMHQGLRLRAEIKTARQHFMELLNSEEAPRTSDLMEAYPQDVNTDSRTGDPIYTLLRRASEKLQQSPSLGTNVLCLRKNSRVGTPIKTNPRTYLSTSAKRKLSCDTFPHVAKLPKFYHNSDECLDNELNENKENYMLNSGVATPNKKSTQKKRRSSLKKLLTPKRRRSGSFDVPPPKMPRMGVRAKLVGASTGNDMVPTEMTTPSNTNVPQTLPMKCTELRMPAEGCDSKDSRDSAYQSTVVSMNETYRTAELSSYHYSDSPSSYILTDSTRTMKPIVKDAIKQAAGQFMPSDTVRTTPCRKIEKPTKPLNRFNVSELLSECDVTAADSTKVDTNNTNTVNNNTTFPGDISKLSFISQSHTTMREQTSEVNLVVPGAMHSTFNYPLHSTMNYPLSSTINNIQSPHMPDINESQEEDISDCDSSVLSLDVDDLSFNFDEETMGSCDVCKVVGLRRQMAQPKLDKRRRPPVGLSETEIDFEARFPRGRLPPVGASQSILDANKTLMNSSNDTLNVTVGSIPNMSSLTELDDTVIPNQSSKRYSTSSSNTLKGSNSTSGTCNSSRKTKKHRRSSKVFMLGLEGDDKENMNFFNRGHEDPRRKALRSKPQVESMKTPMYPEYSSDYSTLSNSSSMDSSQKKVLRKKMKSFNASQRSMNSSGVTTLGFL